MKPTIYDIQVQVDDPIRIRMSQLILKPVNMWTLRQMASWDDRTVLAVQAVTNSKLKIDFLSKFSLDPVDHINRWMASQKIDLDRILGEVGKGFAGGMGLPWYTGGGGTTTGSSGAGASGGGGNAGAAGGETGPGQDEYGGGSGGGSAGTGTGTGPGAGTGASASASGIVSSGGGGGNIPSDEWRRGGPNSLWARPEVRETVRGMLTSRRL